MKKTFALLLTLAMLLTLAACGNSGSASVNYGGTPTSPSGDPTTAPSSDPTSEPTSEPTEPTSEPTEPTSEPTEPTSEPTEPTSEPTKPTDPPTPDPDPVPVPTPVADPFTNSTNYNNAPIGEVSVQPKYVYWEDGMLIAECFVCNGTDKTVYNINVEKLSFTGNTGLLAEGSFGACTGMTLEPMTYEEWTFRFLPDSVKQYGKDLSSLTTAWGVRYSP